MISGRVFAAIASGALLASGAAASAAGAGPHGRAVVADSMMGGSAEKGRYGGPVYRGAPALPVTVALVVAGGGPGKFSTATALTSMVGSDLVNAEVAKLTKQYGKDRVTLWLKTFDFAVNDAVKVATDAGVKLPAPADLSGKKLAGTLVQAGTYSDGTFYIEYLLDKAVSHKIHDQVMDNIDKEPALGPKADLDYHRISNQAFYDLAQALGMTSVKLADLH